MMLSSQQRVAASSRAPKRSATPARPGQWRSISSRSTGSKSAAVVVVAAVTYAPRVAGRKVIAAPRGTFTSSRPVLQSTRLQRRSVVRTRGSSRSAAVNVQANLFARISRLIKSTIDRFVGNFEDPEKLLDRVVEEMTTDSVRMRQAAAQAIASERQMKARADSVQAAADQWLRRAELAVGQGQDDLAREALSRRKTIQADADRLKQQALAQKNACDQLQGSVRMLESKISEARNKKETLKARAVSAKSSMAINEMIGGLRSVGENSFAAFSKMEEKVMALEAEAQATNAMVAPDALEARFEALEGGGGVEDELRMLKAAASNGNSNRNAVAQSRPRVDDVFVRTPQQQPAMVDSGIENELNELRRRARM